MGKRYSLWDGNKKIGDIYEEESRVDTTSQDNQLSMLSQWISEMDYLDKKEKEERLQKEQKKQIYSSMSESDKNEYNEKLRKLTAKKESIQKTHDDLKNNIEDKSKKIKNFTNRYFCILPFTITMLYLLYLSFKLGEWKNYSPIAMIIWLAIFGVVGYFIYSVIAEFIASIIYNISCREKKKQLSSYMDTINSLDKEIKNLIYNYTTEYKPPKW